MAENRFKQEDKKEKEENKKEAPAKSKKSTSSSFDFLKDPRLHLVGGLSLLILSVAMTLAFTSYLFSGQADQSVFEGMHEGVSIQEGGHETQNWLGLFGVWLAQLFIFRWFGIASYLLIPIVFGLGYRIVFKVWLSYFSSIVSSATFGLIWISLTLGYAVHLSDSSSYLQYISGGIGYQFAVLLDNLIGWGTGLALLLSLGVYAIFFFNITSLAPSQKEAIEEEDQDEKPIKKGTNAIIFNPGGNDGDSDALFPSQPFEDDPIHEVLDPIEEEEELEELNEEDYQLITKNNSIPPAKPIQELSLDIEEVVEEAEPTMADAPPIIDEELGLPAGLEDYDPTLELASYRFPHIDLLKDHSGTKVQVSREELEANKDRIVETLGNYKIGISSIKATIGPTVTLYEIVPEAGIKISKIKNLEDDIALSLSALGIRIIAPIPGKGTIGIEVPNKNREMVSVRSVVASEKFQKNSMELPIVFGKTISNEVFVIDLAKMPHVLMAGATGQGKSVGLNIILASLIYKKHPSQLKFVLVDPKKVELSVFHKIERHFLAKLPDTEEAIITDTKKVIFTLNSLCIEMDNRYDLLKDAGCRNIKEYNAKFVERRLNPNLGHRFLPYIVLVIDELADLMMTAGKEVETPIARLAQLARAIGIHLIVATQRPSVNVITGIIKANFPARISFKVTSKIDSRTILDAGGAEQLVGQGDMLMSQGSEMIRVQCAFIDTPEVEAICDFVGEQRGYPSAYHLPEYYDENGEGNGKGSVDLSDIDSMFEEAARLIVTHQQGSTSLIQRKLKLGYNRAGRLIDQLEAAGIVGAFEGSKAREVLIQDESSLEQLLRDLNIK